MIFHLQPEINGIESGFLKLIWLVSGINAIINLKIHKFFVNAMQGHGFPVLGIAWNHGENLLASSDFYGVVIVWKRERTNQNKHTQQQ